MWRPCSSYTHTHTHIHTHTHTHIHTHTHAHTHTHTHMLYSQVHRVHDESRVPKHATHTASRQSPVPEARASGQHHSRSDNRSFVLCSTCVIKTRGQSMAVWTSDARLHCHWVFSGSRVGYVKWYPCLIWPCNRVQHLRDRCLLLTSIGVFHTGRAASDFLTLASKF